MVTSSHFGRPPSFEAEQQPTRPFKKGETERKRAASFSAALPQISFLEPPDEHYSRDLYFICYEAIVLSVFVNFESQVDIRTKIEFVGELLQILENVLFGKMHFLTLGKVSS